MGVSYVHGISSQNPSTGGHLRLGANALGSILIYANTSQFPTSHHHV